MTQKPGVTPEFWRGYRNVVPGALVVWFAIGLVLWWLW
jgi:hypothetical protein